MLCHFLIFEISAIQIHTRRSSYLACHWYYSLLPFPPRSSVSPASVRNPNHDHRLEADVCDGIHTPATIEGLREKNQEKAGTCGGPSGEGAVAGRPAGQKHSENDVDTDSHRPDHFP